MTQPKKADRLFGSPGFIGLTRNPTLRAPVRFEPLPHIEGVKKL